MIYKRYELFLKESGDKFSRVVGCVGAKKIFSSGLVEEERRIKESCLKVWVMGYKIQKLCS